MLLATLLNLLIPQLIKFAIDTGLADGRAIALFAVGGLILLIALIRVVAEFGQRFNGEWLTHRVAYDLRNEFYNAVQHLPFAFHDRTHTGDLMSRATSDIAETERFIGIGLMDLTAALLLLGGVTIAMLWESWQLALLALLPFPILLMATIRFGGTVRPMFKSIQEQMGVFPPPCRKVSPVFAWLKRLPANPMSCKNLIATMMNGLTGVIPSSKPGPTTGLSSPFGRFGHLLAALVWRSPGSGWRLLVWAHSLP
ncbi:MAG: ABC transporter transmembrane domain-containing protein [Chloroflexi bacterium]|nr:ABC transporter transmembrane domain-containing protein [Chloroflexota bacterium]